MFNFFHSKKRGKENDRFKSRIEYLEVKEKYLATFQKITLSTLADLNFEKLTQTIVNLIVKNFQYTSSVLFIIPKGENYIYSHTVSEILISNFILERFGKSFREHKADLETDNSLIVRTAREKKVFEDKVLSHFISPTLSQALSDFTQTTLQIKSTISLPIISNNEVLGVIMFNSRQDHFLDEEKEALNIFVQQLAIAIKNSLLYKNTLEQKVEIESKERAQKIVFRITNELITSLDPQVVAKRAVDFIPQETGIFGAILCLATPATHTLRAIAVTETNFEKTIRSIIKKDYSDFPSDLEDPETYHADVVLAFKNEKLVISPDLETAFSPALPAPLASTLQQVLKIKSVVSLPIRSSARVIGVISFIFLDKDPAELQDDDLSLVKIITNQIGIALDNAFLHKKIEEYSIMLKESVDKYLALAQEQKDTIDVMGHEIRTPLTAIVQEIKLQKQVLFPDEEKYINGTATTEEYKKAMALIFDTFKTIDRASAHQLGIVIDMLETARLDKDRFELNYSTFNIAELIQNNVELMKKTISTPIYTITFTTKESAAETAIEADEVRVAQAVQALISNALKYGINPQTRQSQIDISLELKNNSVIISVKDNGIGIAKEDISKLGQKFLRLDPHMSSNLKRPGGTGLGLFVVKGITEHHGGKLEIESAGIGKGSTFSIVIPVKKPKVNTIKTTTKLDATAQNI